MRDAVHLQRFRIRSPVLDEDHIITTSAIRDLAIEKLKRKAATSSKTSPSLPAIGRPSRISQLQQTTVASTSRLR